MPTRRTHFDSPTDRMSAENEAFAKQADAFFKASFDGAMDRMRTIAPEIIRTQEFQLLLASVFTAVALPSVISRGTDPYEGISASEIGKQAAERLTSWYEKAIEDRAKEGQR